MAFLDQLRGELNDELTVAENIASDRDEVVVGGVRKHVYSYLSDFLFTPERTRTPVKALSGGEKARLMLAKLFLKPSNLLIMDEPTNHLDIGSCEALENALMAFDGTIIAVSHDRYFINRIATRIIELAPSSERGLYDYALEDYDDAYTEYMRLRELKKISEKPQSSESAPTVAKLSYEERKRENAERRSLEKKKERAQKRITELESELEALEEELFGDAASDYKRAAEIEERKGEIEEELLELYELVM
jgi:ABC-type multidrug transport system ATPase subunit